MAATDPSMKNKLSKAKKAYLKGPSAGKSGRKPRKPANTATSQQQQQPTQKEPAMTTTTTMSESAVSDAPVKEKKRKPKTYPDQSAMLALAGLINDTKEVTIERKLQKEAQISEKIAARDAKLQERRQKKQEKLNEIKRALIEKKSKKARRTQSQANKQKDVKENAATPSTKRVRFA
ncbi:hypothetical protein SYNPS1DRAFT_31817 [Syncephalis pseudoplumigaleata]|uniref:60S ribosomal subunit assembly/export protein loc1 n=1 Tax=Syncephalis pseudoplumigaleata TaxID=1712513 RepID=A0A4P9YRS2_9FUNG|nr:hypothetical protein SYNPS1DRAFT_31817 [Syncephalis pseudoplumigaleata]|eukprot:RKP22576.1 hypothetical protein SYNPS1DRAFT_31817 [Syncephalis pseudoplumigaleata]